MGTPLLSTKIIVLGTLVCVLGLSLFQDGRLCKQDFPPNSQSPHIGMAPAHFVSLPVLPVLKWPLLVSLVVGLVQPDFRRLPMMAAVRPLRGPKHEGKRKASEEATESSR